MKFQPSNSLLKLWGSAKVSSVCQGNVWSVLHGPHEHTHTHMLRSPNQSCTQACSCSWVGLCMSHHIVKSKHWYHICLDDLFSFVDVWWFYKYQADTPGCVITTVQQNTTSLLDFWLWPYSPRKRERFEYNCCLNTSDKDERLCKWCAFVYVIAACQ